MGSGISAPGSGSQAMGSGSAVSRSIRVRVVSLLWDQGPKCVTLLESRIRNLGTDKNGISDEKNIPCYDPATNIKHGKICVIKRNEKSLLNFNQLLSTEMQNQM